MSGNEEYVILAQRKCAIECLIRVLQDRFVDGDMPAKDRIICEEVPYKDREVRQSVILDLKEDLEQRAHDLQVEMSQFITVRKKDAQRLQTSTKSPSTQETTPNTSTTPTPGSPVGGSGSAQEGVPKKH